MWAGSSHPTQPKLLQQPRCPARLNKSSAHPGKRGAAYSIPMEMRETATTSKSRMLKEFLQKEPLCRKAP